jgi:hypothetical protein
MTNVNTFTWEMKWYLSFCKNMAKTEGYCNARDVREYFEHRFKKVSNTIWGNYSIVKLGNELTIEHLGTHKKGIAKCNPKDKFNIITGLAIAWARYNKEDIPIYEAVPISELQNGDTFFDTGHQYIFVAKSPITEKRYVVYEKINNDEYKLTTRYYDNDYILYTYSPLGQ